MPSINEKKVPQYWRSLDQIAQTPAFKEFVEREFPEHASEWLDASRRGFLKLMAASFALAGLTGCMRWPEEKIAEYAHRPANRSPGVPVNYTTAMEIQGVVQGLLVTSYDGRPTKIEGNPNHPLNKGATDRFAQASILDMYDPDRSRGVFKGQNPASWDDFVSSSKGLVGPGFYVLSEASSSPSVAAYKKKITDAGGAWLEYEPTGNDNAIQGAKLAFGSPGNPVYEFGKAKVIVVLDADPLSDDPMMVKYARDFADGRRLRDPKTGDANDAGSLEMNRLFVFEAMFTNTGSNADHRVAVASKDIAAVAAQLAITIGVEGADRLPELDGWHQSVGATFPKLVGASLKAVHMAKKIAAELKAAGANGVVMAGCRQPVEVHALAAAINAALGAIGNTVNYLAVEDRPSHVESISTLVADLNAGKVKTLLIAGGNPVYNAPADLDFSAALKKAAASIHLNNYRDETSVQCAWHLPKAHYLESWGDLANVDGSITIAQPLIDPIFGGKSTVELLSMLLGENKSGLEIVRETQGISTTDWKWKKGLFDGVIAGTAPATAPTAKVDAAGVIAKIAPVIEHAAMQNVQYIGNYPLEIIFHADSKVIDGRFSNNGWMQELPDPMTKITWDNAALMSPATAKALGVDSDELLTVTVGGKSITIVSYIMPGMADNSVAIALGYGRSNAGNIGGIAEGLEAFQVGFNAYPLRTTNAMHFATGSVQKSGGKYKISTTQDHHLVDVVGVSMYRERVPEMIREVDLEQYKADQAAQKKTIYLSLFNEHNYDQGHKWGMTIDLTSCVGCAVCTVACQAENNIPIVGKEAVARGREMHWIRVDRYFVSRDNGRPDEGDLDSPTTAVHQPVPCMHCENAPCEEVCPVAATTHSSEGLNQMVYNRCIGTRYCSNNCPYKVRRFNFFDYNRGTIHNEKVPNLLRDEIDDLARMQKNPEVTVRMRGVMEKCTYCVQRIEGSRIQANIRGRNSGKAEDFQIKDGEITPACAQACPTGAIVFGDLNDVSSRVSKLQAQARSYNLLEELNTKPRTVYLTQVRNPSSDFIEKAT